MRHALTLCAALLITSACGESIGPDENEELCTATQATGTIAVGQTRSGTLSIADCILPNEVRGQGWELTIAETTVVQANLTSDAFDAVVVITDEEFFLIGADDDSGEGTNTSLITSLAPGTYMVWATSLDGGEGNYDLTVGPAQAPTCVEETPTGSITIGETIEGQLDPGDCLMANGAVAERWQLTTVTAQTVRVDQSSALFDAYLYISDANGRFIAADDDGGDGLDSRIEITLDPGTYLLWASSFEPGAGTFDLSVAAADPVAGPAGSAPSALRFENLRVKPNPTSERSGSKVRT